MYFEDDGRARDPTPFERPELDTLGFENSTGPLGNSVSAEVARPPAFPVTNHSVPERAVRPFDRSFPSLPRTAKLRASGRARGVQDTASQVQSESEI
jgi:hypothetical protein